MFNKSKKINDKVVNELCFDILALIDSSIIYETNKGTDMFLKTTKLVM